jgi:hypothetical protein
MKTTLQATLIAICACGMAVAQAQTTVTSAGDIPQGYGSLGGTADPASVLQQLPPDIQSHAVVYNGQVYLPQNDILQTGLTQQQAGVAAGSSASAGAAAAGSTAIIVAVGVGVFAVIGAIVAGSSTNGGSSSTATSTSTSTTH